MGGGGITLPNTTRYREEYLVDTETNEIIYPYTKAENILGLDISELLPGGSADKDSYFKLSTKQFATTSGNTRYLFTNIPVSPGIWLVNTQIWQVSGVNSPNNAIVLNLDVGTDHGACWIPSFSEYMQLNCSLLTRTDNDSTVNVSTNSIIVIRNFTCTLAGIKLANL